MTNVIKQTDPNEFIKVSFNELYEIKQKLQTLNMMAITASNQGLWHALGGIRTEEARLNELRKAYHFYE
ncbi:hypothetical protein BCPG3_145 [Bacillus phage BCPG3]|uniref:Uncharacterized protein n=1 Tax=Bacillus phage BPS10C TaxID=1277886 RepID=W5QUV8_9CAUD|nr:hypothetical protein BPS10C_160 [Bacillus phage BPS10C]AGI12157.1 hypothetical protein BPS10C_160 [Bacillus phage BPS10C]QSJ04462.1 hypothetical protein BCPG3_145 [Bacillus phage BCPG3]